MKTELLKYEKKHLPEIVINYHTSEKVLRRNKFRRMRHDEKNNYWRKKL